LFQFITLPLRNERATRFSTFSGNSFCRALVGAAVEPARKRSPKPAQAALERARGDSTDLRHSIFPSIGVERYTLNAVRKDLPNRNTGRNTLMLDHFTRREIPVPVRTPQAWLRRFNSAFVSRLGCKHCSDAAVS
jgi:hypothetical protein